MLEMEMRWVEVLADGSEGLGTPFFDTYFEDTYRFKMAATPTEDAMGVRIESLRVISSII